MKWGTKQRLSYRLYLMTMRFEGAWCMAVRRCLVNAMLGRRHVLLNIFPDVFLEGCEGLSLGDNVSINRGSNLSCAGGLRIGDNVSIGHSASILTTEHQFRNRDIPIKRQPVDFAPVEIGSDVWIGARTCVLAGVSIAYGTVVAAGAVVTRSIEAEGAIVAGVPARTIGNR